MRTRKERCAVAEAQSEKAQRMAEQQLIDALVAEHVMGWKPWLLPQDPANSHWPWGKILQPPDFCPPKPSSLLIKLKGDQPLCQAWVEGKMAGCHNLPHYTTWEGMEQVIRNREAAGFHWLVKSPFDPGEPYWAGLTPQGTNGWNGKPDFYESGPTEPVARCLAALASVGVRVKAETFAID